MYENVTKLWTLSVGPSAPRTYGHLGGTFSRNAYRRLATIGKQNAYIAVVAQRLVSGADVPGAVPD